MREIPVIRDVGPNGSVVLRPPRPGEVEDLRRRGFDQLITNVPEETFREAQRRQMQQQQESNQPLGAAFDAAVNAAGGGVPAILLHGLNPLAAEHMAARAEANEGASITGAIVGSVAPALLTGGESALGEAGLLTAPGLSAASGQAASRALAEYLTQRGLSAGVAESLGGVLGATTDATLSGILGSFSDDTLHDRPIDIERAASSAGISGLLGLGIGSVGALGTGLRGTAARAMGRTAARMESAGLDHAAAVLRGEVPPQMGALENLLDLASTRLGRSSDETRMLADPAVSRLAIESEGRVNDLIRNVANHTDDAIRVTDEISPLPSQRTAQFNEMLDSTPTRSWGPSATHAAGTINAVARSFETLAETTADRATASALRGHAQALDNVATRVFSGNDVSQARMFQVLDDVEHTLGRARTQSLTPAAQEVIDQGRRTVQAAMESEPVFGRAGLAQRELRAATDQYTAARQAFLRDAGGQTAEGPRVDPSRIRQMFLESPNPAGDRRVANLENFLDSSVHYRETLARYYHIRDFEAEALNEVGKQIRRDLAEGSTRIQAVNLASRVVRQERGESGYAIASGISGPRIAGAVGGMAVGGAPGAVLGTIGGSALSLLAGAVLRPAAFRLQKARILAAIRGTASREASAFTRLRSALTGRGTPTIQSLTTAARRIPGTISQLRNGETREEAYGRIVDEIQQLAGNPEELGARLEMTTADLHDFPGFQENMGITAQRALVYMSSVIPPASQPGIFDHLQRMRPSNAEMDIFLARMEALEDPFSIVEFAATRRLYPEAVEAVAVVYPELYAQIQSQTAEIIGGLRTLPPYQSRAYVGMLLQVPTDPSLEPQMIQQLQSRYAQTPHQQQQIMGHSRTMARNHAQSTYSETQSLELRL